LYLYSFDSSLHVQLAFAMGQAFLRWAELRAAGVFFYIALPFAIACIYAGQLVRRRKKSAGTLAAFLIAGPLGVVFYNLFPAMGPIHVFRSVFPWHPLNYNQGSRLYLEALRLPGPRNAIPSLHMAWVLLAWWLSKGCSWWERVLAALFVAFTALATLGTGEHYFVDLIVAFPFALMIMGLCAFDLPWQNAARLRASFYGLLATLAWIVALRYEIRVFLLSPIISWTACAATVALAVILERRLWQADSMGSEESASHLPPAISCEPTAPEPRPFQA